MLLPVTTDLAMSTLRAAGPPPGHPHRRRHRRGARQDPARGPLGRLQPRRGRRRRPPPAAGLLRHHRRHPAVGADPPRRLALGRSRPTRSSALLPALERALTWQVEHGDADGDLLLEYVDRSGHGLSNQGWKDSGDAVRRSDGSRASVAARAGRGAGLRLRRRRARRRPARGVRPAGHRPVAGVGRAACARSSARASGSRTPSAPFPAIALDRDKRPVVSLTSNIGHLLGTGILDAEGVDVVARRLVGPDMLSGFGIRTLSTAGRRLLADRLPRRLGLAARHRHLPGRSRRRGPPGDRAGRRGAARGARRLRRPPAGALRRRRARRATRCRCPTRRRAVRRPGRPRRRCRSSARSSACGRSGRDRVAVDAGAAVVLRRDADLGSRHPRPAGRDRRVGRRHRAIGARLRASGPSHAHRGVGRVRCSGQHSRHIRDGPLRRGRSEEDP